MEGQWYGIVSDDKKRLVSVGDRESALGEGSFCVQVNEESRPFIARIICASLQNRLNTMNTNAC